MNFAFDHPAWLFSLALLLVMVPFGLLAFTALAKVRRRAAVVLRCVLMVVVAAAMAGLARVHFTNRLAVVIVSDASASVLQGAPFGPDALFVGLDGLDRLSQRLNAELGDEDLLGLVTFDGAPTPLWVPSSGQIGPLATARTPKDGSRIQAALALATGLIPPDSNGRIVLISDGIETEPGALVSPLGIAIDVLPIRYTLTNEVIVESLDTPPRAAGESTIAARIKLSASGPSEGVLRIFSDGAAVGSRRVSLAAGESIERFEVPLGDGRVHRFRAVFEPDEVASGDATQFSGDTIAQNNSAESITLSPGAGRILFVRRTGNTDDPVADSPLQGVLAAAGLPVEVVTAERMPDDAAAFQAFDAVVLEDVPADEVSSRSQTALAEFVREIGGGLVVVGGRHSFGAGGWRDTPIEPLLPVNLKLPDRVVTPDTATVFVLDNSGSMRRFVMGSMRTQQDVANDAAALAAGLLSASDELGVVTFNTDADVLVPLARNVNVEPTRARIRRISPGGGTNIVAGMELAKRELSKSKAKSRHMVVLSDGKSMNADRLPALADSCREAGIKVSAIAVGDDADVLGLEEIAERGGGAYHFVFNPDLLPKVFVKTVKLVRSPLVRDEVFSPLVVQSSALWTFGDAPSLGGLALTSLKTDPIVSTVLLSPQGEPVLASARAGLGGVVAFTSDASEWGSPWHTWPGFRPFWTNAVRSVMRASDEGGPSVEMKAERGSIRVRIGVPPGINDVGRVSVRLYGPTGEAIESQADMIDPDTFEAAIPATESGPYVAVVRAGLAAVPVSAATTIPRVPEFAQISTDMQTLESIARVSGGRVLSPIEVSARALFDRTGLEPKRSLVAWWPRLLVWLPILFLLDVACRRVAWDRWLVRERAAAPRVAAEFPVISRSPEATTARQSPSLVLDDRDAENLRQAARDRRRARRLRTETSEPLRPAETNLDNPAPVEETGFLAAKRRAKDRFDDTDR